MKEKTPREFQPLFRDLQNLITEVEKEIKKLFPKYYKKKYVDSKLS